VFFYELCDVTTDRVPRVTHCDAVIEPCRLQRRWTFNRPFLPPNCARKYRTRPFLLPIAKSNDIVKSFTEIWINNLGPCRRNVDADLLHRRYRICVQTACFRSRAYNLEFIAAQRTKKSFRHLSAAGIFSAKKQDFGFDRHVFSYLQNCVILVGLIALLRVQHSA
jgi:hypothetical protein